MKIKLNIEATRDFSWEGAQARLEILHMSPKRANVQFRILSFLGNFTVNADIPLVMRRDRWEVSGAVLPCPGRTPLMLIRGGWKAEHPDTPVIWSNRR